MLHRNLDCPTEQAMPCPALPCPALPCPALPCPALPCPGQQIHRQPSLNPVLSQLLCHCMLKDQQGVLRFDRLLLTVAYVFR